MKKVNFHLNDQPVYLKNRKRLSVFIERLFKKEKKKFDRLQIIFCSDEKLLDLNKKFLNHSFFTDILTFDLGNSQEVNGELYISYPRIKENASIFQNSISDELHRTIIHGILHLCGYTDKHPVEKNEMDKLQEKYLHVYKQSLTVPRGTKH